MRMHASDWECCDSAEDFTHTCLIYLALVVDARISLALCPNDNCNTNMNALLMCQTLDGAATAQVIA